MICGDFSYYGYDESTTQLYLDIPNIFPTNIIQSVAGNTMVSWRGAMCYYARRVWLKKLDSHFHLVIVLYQLSLGLYLLLKFFQYNLILNIRPLRKRKCDYVQFLTLYDIGKAKIAVQLTWLLVVQCIFFVVVTRPIYSTLHTIYIVGKNDWQYHEPQRITKEGTQNK